MRSVLKNAFLSILMVIFAYAIFNSYAKIKDGKIGINMKQKLERSFAFPSVTVCNYDTLWFNRSRTPESFKRIMNQNDTGGPNMVIEVRDGHRVSE